MATSLLGSSFSISNFPENKLNHVGLNTKFTKFPSTRSFQEISVNCKRTSISVVTRAKMSSQVDVPVKESTSVDDNLGIVNIHHVGLLCSNLERSLEFYQNLLGLKINEARPHDKLPYRGVWFWVGSEMIHLMELPNPDPLTGRPEHGGRDRHACIGIKDVSKLKNVFDKAGIPYTLSKSGRPAIFTRDPDANALEFTQI
ncbi:hypothetical protein ACHQM5_029661 [Ranunculus cassubicifolius]